MLNSEKTIRIGRAKSFQRMEDILARITSLIRLRKVFVRGAVIRAILKSITTIETLPTQSPIIL